MTCTCTPMSTCAECAEKMMSEREVLDIAEQSRGYASAHTSLVFLMDFARRVTAAAVAKERERCAQLCEQWDATHPERIAKLIRTGH